jgi:hypothetical protein
MQITLSTDDIDLLVNHKGYGVKPADNVRTLIIGNESGIGNAINVEEFLKSLAGQDYIQKPTIKALPLRSPFIQSVSRITRALEGKQGNWFSPKATCDVWDKIINGDSLSESGHLIDIRPLPRPDESGWFFTNVDRKQYESGFRKFHSSDSVVQSLIVERLKALRAEVATFQNLEYIVAPGAAPMKLKFLKHLFPSIEFEATEIRTSRKSMTYFKSKLHLDDKEVKVLVTPFFDWRIIGYEGLEEAYKILKK